MEWIEDSQQFVFWTFAEFEHDALELGWRTAEWRWFWSELDVAWPP
jgi:hypothetical protein